MLEPEKTTDHDLTTHAQCTDYTYGVLTLGTRNRPTLMWDERLPVRAVLKLLVAEMVLLAKNDTESPTRPNEPDKSRDQQDLAQRLPRSPHVPKRPTVSHPWSARP